tara:strand:+ start:401 stop:910 length:510 start_codon:yes stop_codon:yes gene_type:complete
MRKNRKIIELTGDKIPVIYIRFYKDKVIYIGETSDSRQGRPVREDHNWDIDKVIPLKACKNKDRRMYWEAYLICKFKPVAMNTGKYKLYLLKRNNKNPSHEFKQDLKKLKNQWTENARNNLERMRGVNNEKRSLYWKHQAVYALEHMHESMRMYKHFKEDGERQKNEME